jgi:hypothetical protein
MAAAVKSARWPQQMMGPSHQDGGPRRIVERLDRTRVAAEIDRAPTTHAKQNRL